MDIFGCHQLHVPVGKKPFTKLIFFSKKHNIRVAWIGSDDLKQTGHVVSGAFQPLEEDTATEYQQPRDTKSGVMVFGGGNYFLERVFIHVLSSLTAVHDVMDRLG